MSENPMDDFINKFLPKHGEENWVTVYKHIPTGDGEIDGGMYCALMSQGQTEEAMGTYTWDLTIGSGGPDYCTTYEGGEEATKYCKGSEEGLLRIVLNRDFQGKRPGYIEILEEFRLFHNLYFDHKNQTFLSFDDAGDEVEVIKLSSGEVKIRRTYLRSFMAARQMNLLLYFELTKHFGVRVGHRSTHCSKFQHYTIYSGDSYVDGYASYVRVLGKKLLLCEPIETSGVGPFSREKNYQGFMTGGDSDSPVEFSCNPDLLATYFGANPDAPHYLTPIFFKKEVMQKYYGSSDYEIRDGRLERKGAWSLRFDNNSSDHVSVFLGDLGRDLPEKEQIYWKSFNLLPDGRTISNTSFQRSFMGNFYDAESPEHLFKYKFGELQEYWQKKYGWQLFLPLSPKDEHFFSSVRSMLSQEQSEFDSLILALAKVTIDSVNVKNLRAYVGVSEPDSKSIVLMELLLTKLQSTDVTSGVSLLRGIQSVRSAGVAHRKGTEYDKLMARLNIDEDDYRLEFDQVLRGMTDLLNELIDLDSKLPKL